MASKATSISGSKGFKYHDATTFERYQLIRKRLGLKDIPQIKIIERPFRKLKNSKRYKLEEPKEIVESAEYYCGEGYLNRPVSEFGDEYLQLSHDTDNSKPFDIRLIEAGLHLAR